MNIGAYQLKYPFRKLLSKIIPHFKDVDPNAITRLILLVGFFAAISYYFAYREPLMYFFGIFFIFFRMFLATMDGLIAETYKKSSAKGEILNRVIPEIADIFLLIALSWQHPQLGIFVISFAWLSAVMGLVPLLVKKDVLSIGPLGQTDRLIALIIFTIMMYLQTIFEWNVDFTYVFLWFCLVGGVLTSANRFRKVYFK